MVLKNTIQSPLKPILRAYDTCYEVWEEAKLLYTNDIQHLYDVCHKNPMADYLGKMNALFS